MAEKLPTPDPLAFDRFLRQHAKALRADDKAPASKKEWESRRESLRHKMLDAMGPMPEKPCELQPKIVKTLKRDGYRIENIIFQSRPEVRVTANAYVPTNVKGKVPAVLCVHGHFRGARRDPVIQARCLGLVKLGFFVLAVDAFGAGERYSKQQWGSYHGALYGSSLWPSGHTLLGMQVNDNRRAVDYLCSRPEVDTKHLGITGASGGGNQTMYAGALDERIQAVVPVCSVGNYQAYLHAACCVCEVLPGALTFTEEGDVLGLVAPRALMVINATRDGFQFSVGEAKKSFARAQAIFKLHDSEKKVKHAIFEAGHGYHKPMREAMYGWMTQWLKGEGKGQPIAEPKILTEKPEDLSCWTEPKTLVPASFAEREGKQLIAKHDRVKLKHREDWESTAVFMRSQFEKKVLGPFPPSRPTKGKAGKESEKDGIITQEVWIQSEPGIDLPITFKVKKSSGRLPTCILLDLEGQKSALKHPIVDVLLRTGWLVVTPDLRATGALKPKRDQIRAAVDHNSAEHSLWVGRPLLGQWVVDVRAIITGVAGQAFVNPRRIAVVGVNHAGIVALCSAAILEAQINSIACLNLPVSYISDTPHDAKAMRMGLQTPGILKVGDIPHLAALSAPRSLQVIGGVSPSGESLTKEKLVKRFDFTAGIYKLHKDSKLRISDRVDAKVVKDL